MIETIKSAIEAAKNHGYEIPEKIKKSVEDIENPTYRVAVVGKYQVGKSTLINRAFLGDKPLLSEGWGICNTAVVTDNEYGESAKLEVYEWADDGSEKLVKSVDAPTAVDVKEATVSSSAATRTDLAKRVSRVRIVVPNESLKGYAITDTPGLDDPNKELLLNTTYRIIPQSDVAVLVVTPRQLDQVEENLLRADLIGHGVSRLMILVSYNPEVDHLDSERRAQVVDVIKDQLDKIGRSDIPVEMYCFDQSIGDIINDVSELRLTIRPFLENNALKGRMNRVAFTVKQALENIELEIAARLKASCVSVEEKAALQKRLQEEIDAFRQECEKTYSGLLDDMENIKDEARKNVTVAIEGAFATFDQNLTMAAGFAAVRQVLANADSTLKNDLTVRLSAVCADIKTSVLSAVTRRYSAFKVAIDRWNVFLGEDFGVNRPFVAKIPAFVIDTINFGVMNVIFGPIWAVLGYVFHLPIVNPTDWLVRRMVLSQVRSGLEPQKEEVCRQVMEQIVRNLDATLLEIKTGMETSNKAQVEAMQKALADQGTENSAALEAAKNDISNAISSLTTKMESVENETLSR